MALSGTIEGKFSGTAASNVKPIIEWKATQNIGKNQSTITSSLVFIKGNSYWYPFNLSGHNVTMAIGSYKHTNSRTFDLRSKTREVVWTRTTTVNHNADGSLKINLTASGNTGISNVGSYNLSETVTLNNIPRKSTMTVTPTTQEFGKPISFKVSKASSGFKHLINYSMNGTSGEAVAMTATTDLTWTIPTDLMKFSPTETSVTINLWLDTYSGSTKVGVNQYTIKATVPSNVVPSISKFSARELNTRLASFKLSSNNFLQGNSQIEFSSTATAGNGAKLSSSTIEVVGVSNINAGSGTIDLSSLSTHSGVKVAKLTVRDSRGRTATSSFNITINAYSPPKISKFTATRDGTNIKVNKLVTYSNIGSNVITYSLTRDGGTKVGDITHDKNDYVFGGYPQEKSFVFTLQVNDSLNSSSSVSNISTGKQLMHIDQDHGFGIGKYRENGVLDVGGDVYVSGVLDVKKKPTFHAGLTISGTATMTDLTVDRTARVSGGLTSGSISTGNIDANGRVDIKGGKTWGSGGGLHLNNADVMGLNGLYFNDKTENHGEGLMFPRTGTNVPANGVLTSNKYPEWDNFRILDGVGYLNGQEVFQAITDENSVLWSGAYYMTAGHKIPISRKIQDCPNGWVLAWSWFSGGVIKNWDVNFTIVHKSALNGHGFDNLMSTGAANGVVSIANKYIYVRDGGASILGNDNNTKGYSTNFVLKGVYAW